MQQQYPEPSMHRLVRPKGGDCLVKQVKAVCSVQTQQYKGYMIILHSVVDTYLVDVEWVPVVQLLNNTASAITLPVTLKSQFVVVQNRQTLGLRDSVDGLCIKSDGKPFKTFRAQETSSPETKELSFNVEPNNYIVIYQRRWRFKHKLWFISTLEDGEERIVGKRPSRADDYESPFPIIERNVESYIDSCAYTTIDRSSPGFNDAVEEVDITPVKEEFTKGTMRMGITFIPILHQEAIARLLV